MTNKCLKAARSLYHLSTATPTTARAVRVRIYAMYSKSHISVCSKSPQLRAAVHQVRGVHGSASRTRAQCEPHARSFTDQPRSLLGA